MMKKQGALIYDHNTGRYNIRFDLDRYYGGLHCGNSLDVWVGSRWMPTRIEYADGWYLIDVDTDTLDGLRVRI